MTIMAETTRKYVCPSCGAQKPFVKEVSDKSRPPIMTGSGLAPMYHHKMICSNCDNEWKTED